MQQKIIGLVAEQLNVPAEQLNASSSHKDVPSWDSLATMRIALALEEEFNVSLSTEEIMSIQSVQSIADILAAKTG